MSEIVRPGRWDAITDVPGVTVGHQTDRRGATGCTVILCPAASAAAVDARGGAPGTRETDVLGMANVVRTCHAVVFAGGSAFGLGAAQGVMRFLAERGVGFETTVAKVPIVSAAVIFDLGIGKSGAFPSADDGYRAAANAKAGRVAQGSVGAGTGATVAKLLGNEARLKGGAGTASLTHPDGLIVAALAITNAVGSIYDPETGALVAGPLDEQGEMTGMADVLVRRRARMEALLATSTRENTTLVCVATNTNFPHAAMQRLAYQAHDGLARPIMPAHTFGAGDVAFAVAVPSRAPAPDDALLAGILAVQAVERAVLRSVRAARSLAGVKAAPE